MRSLIVCVLGLLVLGGCEKTIKEAQTPVQNQLRPAGVTQSPPLSQPPPKAA